MHIYIYKKKTYIYIYLFIYFVFVYTPRLTAAFGSPCTLTGLGSRATHRHWGLPHFTIWSPPSGAMLMSVTGCDTGCFTQVEPIIV